MAKGNYLVYGFGHIYEAFKSLKLNYNFDYLGSSKIPKYNFITNYFIFKDLHKKGLMNKYDIIHVNFWPNLLNINLKKKDQLWIGESHGIHVGLDRKISLSQSTPLIG